MEEYDYILLGGGISSLTFGRLLQQHTNKSFLILEKESEVGGLCRSKNIEGNHVDIGGGHFLYSKHQKVYDFVFEHVPESNFTKYDRITKIAIHDTFIDYPIENNIWQLSPDLQYKYLTSVIDALSIESDPTNFRLWILKNLGKEIADNYLMPYNNKVWGNTGDLMSVDWLYKIPNVDLKKIVRSIIYKESKGDYPSHEYYYYPKQGGFQIITDSIYGKVKDHVVLNEAITKLEYVIEKGHWVINNKFVSKIVINTVAWTALRNTLTHPKINNLKNNSIVVSLKEKDYNNNWHWCYMPDDKLPYHREFYINNYCTNNANKCVAHETNVNRWVDDGKNLFSHNNEYAYPIPTIDYKKDIKEILEYYEKLNMIGLGRWGTWEYHNSDVCIMKSMELFDKLEGDHKN